MFSAGEDLRSTLLADGTVLIGGGNPGGKSLKSAEIYDPATGLFTQTSHAMKTPRSQHTATLLQDGRVLLVGGKSADLFYPNTQTFTEITQPPANRKNHAALLLSDGSVLITGGYTGGGAVKFAELFDPLTQN